MHVMKCAVNKRILWNNLFINNVCRNKICVEAIRNLIIDSSKEAWIKGMISKCFKAEDLG